VPKLTLTTRQSRLRSLNGQRYPASRTTLPWPLAFGNRSARLRSCAHGMSET